MRLDLADAEIAYQAGFIPSSDRQRLFGELTSTTAWQEDSFKIYGREVPVPRLIAWYGDPGCQYSYSRIVMVPKTWTPTLLEIKQRVESEVGEEFNSVLLNYYRDGRDSVAWHSDDEPELGPAPVIASVSFGAARKFQLRHRSRSRLRHALELEDGSLLVMRGPTQRYWQHQVPKTAQPVGPRVNLTFRTIAG